MRIKTMMRISDTACPPFHISRAGCHHGFHSWFVIEVMERAAGRPAPRPCVPCFPVLSARARLCLALAILVPVMAGLALAGLTLPRLLLAGLTLPRLPLTFT